MILDGKLLTALWKSPDVPVRKGQRLLGLRTHTGNRTMYLFDHDGERPGWISGDVFDKEGFEPSYDEAYIAIVMATQQHNLGPSGPRFKVALSTLPLTSNLAAELRGAAGWPGALGEEPGLIEQSHPELFSLLTTMQPGSPDLNPLFSRSKKELSMSTTKTTGVIARLSRTGSDNADAFKNAAFLEAGVITNKQLAKLAAARLPFMLKGYAEHAIGRLVIANLFKVAVHELRPDNRVLQRLSDASMEAAHLDLLRTIDLDGLIDSLLSEETIKRAMSKLEGEAQ